MEYDGTIRQQLRHHRMSNPIQQNAGTLEQDTQGQSERCPNDYSHKYWTQAPRRIPSYTGGTERPYSEHIYESPVFGRKNEMGPEDRSYFELDPEQVHVVPPNNQRSQRSSQSYETDTTRRYWKIFLFRTARILQGVKFITGIASKHVTIDWINPCRAVFYFRDHRGVCTFYHLFLELQSNGGNTNQNDTRLNTRTICQDSLCIISFLHDIMSQEVMNEKTIRTHLARVTLALFSCRWWHRTRVRNALWNTSVTFMSSRVRNI